MISPERVKPKPHKDCVPRDLLNASAECLGWTVNNKVAYLKLNLRSKELTSVLVTST